MLETMDFSHLPKSKLFPDRYHTLVQSHLHQVKYYANHETNFAKMDFAAHVFQSSDDDNADMSHF